MGYISQNAPPTVSFQSKRLRRSVQPRRGAGRRNLGTRVWHYTLYPNAPHPQNKCDSRTLQKLLTAQTNKKLPPRAPAQNKAKQIFAMQGRVLLGEVLGERGRFGGREPHLSRGGSLPPWSFFLPPSEVFLIPPQSCQTGCCRDERRSRFAQGEHGDCPAQ